MGLLLSRVRQCNACFCPSSVSLFDLKARFFVPTRGSARPSRAGAVKVGCCTNLRHASPLPGHTLTASSTTARSVRSGRRSEGSPLSGADQSRHNLVFGGSKDPNHDAVIRIDSEAPKRRTHSTFRHDSHESPRDPATSNRRRRPVTSGRIGPKLLGAFSDLRSLRRAQNDAVRYHALSHETPQGDH